MKLDYGKHRLSFGDYAEVDAVNASSLLKVKDSPKHYRHYVKHGTKDSDALRLGRATHTAIIEPEQFLLEYVLWDDGMRRGKKWEWFCEQNHNKTILRYQDYDHALALAKAVRTHEPAMKYLGQKGEGEVSFLFMVSDDDRSTDCKCRVDWFCDAIVDVKTTRNINAHAFARDAAKLGYHIRAAFYQDGVMTVTGRMLPVVLIAVEKQPPYDVAVYRVPEDAIESGRDEYRDLLAKLHHCKETNRWPGVVDGERELVFPEWALTPRRSAPRITIGGEEMFL